MRTDWLIGSVLSLLLLLLLFVSCHATTTSPVCQVGFYGDNCQLTCGHCSDTKCNKQTGNCVACALGYNFTADPKCSIACASGTFGSSCSGTCSIHCSPSGTCNHVSGACSPCQAGWTGAQCTVCQDGKYGTACDQNCGNCAQNAVCNKVTGHCPAGCAPGYDPADPFCKKVCDNGRYGAECDQTCGHCGQNAVCNKVTGHCPAGCAPGYDPTDPLCKKECSSTSWGQDCSQSCGDHCVVQGSRRCGKVNGHCPCQPGYKVPFCTDSCDDGKWGQNCQQTCSEHCTDVCQKTNGVCTCKRGYQPSLCTAECSDGRYGQNCVSNCGFCHGGNADCDHVSGNCSRCQDNRVMPFCVDCIAGHWGPTCGQLCGQCGGDGKCDPDNGTCLSSACLAGWTHSTCNVKCGEGTYGEGCALKCGQCRNNSPCRHDNGLCEQDCEDGYTGVLCKTEAESLAAPIAGSVMGAAVLIALTIVIVAVCYMRRCSAKRPQTPNKDFMDTHQTDNGTPQHETLAMRESQVYQNVSETGGATPGHPNYDQTLFARQDSHAYAVHNPGKAPAQDPSYHTYQNTGGPGSNNNQLPKHSGEPVTPEGNYGNVPSPQGPESTYGNVPTKSGGRGKY